MISLNIEYMFLVSFNSFLGFGISNLFFNQINQYLLRSRSRSRRHSSKGHSRHHHSRHRHRSRSHGRSRSSRHSHRRSHSRDRRSRSRDRSRRSRSRSRGRHRRRSRSRGRSADRIRHQMRSRSRSPSVPFERKKERSPPDYDERKRGDKDKPVFDKSKDFSSKKAIEIKPISTSISPVTDSNSNTLSSDHKKDKKPYGRWEPVQKSKPEIDKFTFMCAQISAKERNGDMDGDDNKTNEESEKVHHPFAVTPTPAYIAPYQKPITPMVRTSYTNNCWSISILFLPIPFVPYICFLLSLAH